jgi:nicotinamidase-related amidase
MDRYTEPDFRAAALLTIDTQRDTLDGQPFEVPGTSAILSNMRRLVTAFRTRLLPIVHLVRLYKVDGSNVDLCRRAAAESGHIPLAPDTAGCQLAPGLLPNDDLVLECDRLLTGGTQSVSARETVIYKPRWGAFYRTPLEQHLQSLGITTTVFRLQFSKLSQGVGCRSEREGLPCSSGSRRFGCPLSAANLLSA